MKHDCSIVRDLLPLYLEGMVQEETAEFVRAHLESCPQCRAVRDELKQDPCPAEFSPELPLERFRRKMITKKVQTVLVTVLCVLAVVVSAFAILDTPEYFGYDPELLALTENTDGSVTLTFDEAVTDYACYPQPDPEYEAYSIFGIEAWSSRWDRWFSRKGTQSVTLRPEENKPLRIYYVPNSDQENLCIYGASGLTDSCQQTLPRLAAGYYLGAMAVLFVLLLAAWLLTKNRRCHVWLGRLMLLPVSYAVSHLIVLGTSTVSYSLPRDLRLMACLTVIIWMVLLLIQNLMALHRELHSTD